MKAKNKNPFVTSQLPKQFVLSLGLATHGLASWLAMAALTLPMIGNAASITQSALDAGVGWNSGTIWTGGAAPSAGNTYTTTAGLTGSADTTMGVSVTGRVRSIAGSPTFGGDSLTVESATEILIKDATTPSANIILNGGVIRLSPNTTGNATLSGTLNVAAASYIGLTETAAATFTVNSTITGSGLLHVAAGGAGANYYNTLLFGGDLSGYTGTFDLGGGASPITVKFSQAYNLPSIRMGAYTTVDRLSLDYDLEVGSLSSLATTGRAVVQAASAGTKTLTVGASGLNETFAGAISNGSGTLAVTKTGAGTWTLSGNNTYTGATSVNQGTLALTYANSTIANSGSLTINNGGTVSLQNYNPLGSVPVTINAGGLMTMSGNYNVNLNNTLTLNGGELSSGGFYDATYGSYYMNTNANVTVGSGTSTISATQVTASGVRTFTVAADGALNVTGDFSNRYGSFGLTKAGAGIMTLSGANTYAGATTISSGTLVLSGTNPNTSGIEIQNAAGIALTVNNANTTGSGAIKSSSTGGSDQLRTINLHIDGGGTIVLPNSLAGNTGVATTIDVNNNGSGTNGVIRLAGVNTSTSTNAGSQTYNITGGNGYSLAIDYIQDIGGADGTFLLNPTTANLTLGSFVGANGSGKNYTLELGGSGSVNIVTGEIKAQTGTVAMNKSNTSIWTLAGDNTYTGATTINAGTLVISGNSSAATGAVTVADGATLGGSGNLGGSVTIDAGGHQAITVASTPEAQVTRTISGSLTLIAGNILDLTAGAAPAGGDYTLVTSNGGISGTPTTVNLSGVTGTVSVVGNSLVLTVGAAGGYAGWAATNAPGQSANQDYDNDGVSNGVEYLLGGTATTNDAGKLPAVSVSGGNLVVTFKRKQTSETPDVTAKIEIGTTLATWPTSYPVPNDPVAANPGVTVVDNGDGFDAITLTVPQAPDAKKFARLVVNVN